MRTLGLTLTIALLGLSSSTASAHFNLIAPKPTTNDTSGGKGAPPCGMDTPAATPVAVQGGHPLMIQLKETTFHPGFYRVALSINSRSELPPGNVVKDAAGKILPADGSTKGISKTAEYQNPPIFPVLADNLFPHTTNPPAMYQQEVMLPNVTCDKCTLQVIQFMAEHGWNGNGTVSNGGYFYHHCSDLKITADPALPPFNANGTPDAGAPADAKPDSSSTGAGGTTGAAGTTGIAGSSGGAAGTTGAAGSSVAGTSGGAAGTTGAAGSSSTGTAGTTGAAGTTAGTRGDDGGGGCAVAGGAASLGGLLLGLGALLAARRRRLG